MDLSTTTDLVQIDRRKYKQSKRTNKPNRVWREAEDHFEVGLLDCVTRFRPAFGFLGPTSNDEDAIPLACGSRA